MVHVFHTHTHTHTYKHTWDTKSVWIFVWGPIRLTFWLRPSLSPSLSLFLCFVRGPVLFILILENKRLSIAAKIVDESIPSHSHCVYTWMHVLVSVCFYMKLWSISQQACVVYILLLPPNENVTSKKTNILIIYIHIVSLSNVMWCFGK